MLRLPAAGVVDRLDDFFEDVEVLCFAAAFVAAAFVAGAFVAAAFLAGDFLAAGLDDADAERLALVGWRHPMPRGAVAGAAVGGGVRRGGVRRRGGRGG